MSRYNFVPYCIATYCLIVKQLLCLHTCPLVHIVVMFLLYSCLVYSVWSSVQESFSSYFVDGTLHMTVNDFDFDFDWSEGVHPFSITAALTVFPAVVVVMHYRFCNIG